MNYDTHLIHKEQSKGAGQLQVTFDEDYNLPAYKPDICSVILKQGTVVVDEVTVTKGHVWIKGTLKFQILYRAEGGSLGLCSASGSALFQENLALDHAQEGDIPWVDCLLEDLSVHVTNSRKLAIRGLLTLSVTLTETVDAKIWCRMEKEENIQALTCHHSYLHLTAAGKDQCRIHEELPLPGNKLNIQELLWRDMQLEAVTLQPEEGHLLLKGQLALFCLYQAEPGVRLEWYENRIPVQCSLELRESTSRCICQASITDEDWNLTVQADEEGEPRLLVLEGTIKLAYHLNKEQECDQVQDLYALHKTLIPKTEPLELEQLLMKNASQLKLTDTLTLPPEKKEILQILSCSGEIQINDTQIAGNGLLVNGSLLVRILYLTQEDDLPLDAMEAQIPFQYLIEAPGITTESRYALSQNIYQLSVMMKSKNTLEVQGVLDFCLMVYQPDMVANIVEVEESSLEMQSLLSLPGLTGIRTKPGDSLWSIAKDNHTTRDTILANNPGLEEPLLPGTVLLLMKEITI